MGMYQKKMQNIKSTESVQVKEIRNEKGEKDTLKAINRLTSPSGSISASQGAESRHPCFAG